MKYETTIHKRDIKRHKGKVNMIIYFFDIRWGGLYQTSLICEIVSKKCYQGWKTIPSSASSESKWSPKYPVNILLHSFLDILFNYSNFSITVLFSKFDFLLFSNFAQVDT